MTKRLIGIDIGERTLRVAVLIQGKNGPAVALLEESMHSTPQEQVDHLQELLGDYHLGDRLAACLPTGQAFIRRLQFPFADRRKIAATVPFELSAQLPVSLDDYTMATQTSLPCAGGAELVAAAVETSCVADYLELFDARGVPLHLLDLAPYAYVSGLRDSVTDGLLVFVTELGTSLALVADGQVVDSRHLPYSDQRDPADHARAVCREAGGLRHAAALCESPLLLAGGAVSDALVEALSKAGETVELLSIRLGADQIEAAFVPAVALALRAANTAKDGGFNLRQGRFVLKGEWGGLRKAMILAGCLTALTLLALIVSMVFEYTAQSQQVSALRQQMASIYRETFPGATAPVDIPLQMQSALRALRQEAGLVDGRQPSAVILLRTLSDLPQGVSCDLDELSLEPNEVRITGHTETFDAVNSLAGRYRQSPLFSKVAVTESKMDVTGGRIGFRITLTLKGEGSQP
jgi:general secretion pathway protein L